MKKTLILLLLCASPAAAEDPLNFDIVKLCAWQNTNNSMDIAECTALETEAQKSVTELEPKSEPARKDECTTEARNYSGDSGFASYTVYADCLKSGPGNL